MNSSSDILLLSTKRSEYFRDLIKGRLLDRGIKTRELDLSRSIFPGGERYYRMDIESNFDLLGRVVIYVSSLTCDEEILEVIRVAHTLVQYGVKRRIFVIPYLAYSTMEYASLPGEVVTCKVTVQMLSSFGISSSGNIFLLYDLHSSCILNYFEGPSIRLELSGFSLLISTLKDIGFDRETFMFASADLGRTILVNALAKHQKVQVAFMRRIDHIVNGVKVSHDLEVIGPVSGKNVIIYDDMARSGSAIIEIAEKYLSSGALSVHCIVSHFAPNEENNVRNLARSRIKTFTFINTHPSSQWDVIKKYDKFRILDASEQFVDFLSQIIG